MADRTTQRVKMVNFRATPDECRLLFLNARQAGLSVSAFVRKAAFTPPLPEALARRVDGFARGLGIPPFEVVRRIALSYFAQDEARAQLGAPRIYSEFAREGDSPANMRLPAITEALVEQFRDKFVREIERQEGE